MTPCRRFLLALCATFPTLAAAATQAGKPNAGLAISSDSHYQLQAGSSQSITLSLSSVSQEGLLRLTLSTSSEDLELLSPSRYEFHLAQGAAPSLTLNLLPHQDGRYYLMLNAEIQRQAMPAQAQALGVVVQVGQAQQMHLLKATPAPAVISLPAEETIRAAP
jgi:hypothetical protein